MSPDPWDYGNREREDIYQAQRQLGPNADGGVESANVSMENFDSLSHAAIKKASDNFQPALSNQVSDGWHDLATKFKAALTTFESSLNTAINASWTGLGAEAAKNTITNYRTHAEKTADGLALMATKPAEAATATSQVKALMPDLVEVHPMTANTSHEHSRLQQEEALRQQKENEARMIMRTVYAPVFQQAAAGIPALPDAPQFSDAPAPDVKPMSSDFGTGKPIAPGPIAGADAPVTAALAEDPSASAASAPSMGATSGAGAGGSAPPMSGLPSGLGRTAAANSNAASGNGSSPGSAIPGTYGIGRWARPTAKDDDNDKREAESHPALGPIVGGAFSNGGSVSSVGPSPMQGMGIAQPPTMVPPHANQQHRDDEEEHFTPEFLISLDNGNELVGPMPKVSPAVIGVWNEEHIAYQNPPPSPYDPRPYDSDE